jgi:hypothetical protein
MNSNKLLPNNALVTCMAPPLEVDDHLPSRRSFCFTNKHHLINKKSPAGQINHGLHFLQNNSFLPQNNQRES